MKPSLLALTLLCVAPIAYAQTDIIHSSDLPAKPKLVSPEETAKAAAAMYENKTPAAKADEPDELSIHSERGKPLVVPQRSAGKPRTPEVLTPRTPVADDAEPANVAPEESAYLGAPEIVTESNGVRYVSGGIGKQERALMRSFEPEFKLKLELSAATGHYLSDVTVSVLNPAGEAVVTLVADGPYVLIDLPAGKYKVTATYQELSVSKDVVVNAHLRTYPLTFTGTVM